MDPCHPLEKHRSQEVKMKEVRKKMELEEEEEKEEAL